MQQLYMFTFTYIYKFKILFTYNVEESVSLSHAQNKPHIFLTWFTHLDFFSSLFTLIGILYADLRQLVLLETAEGHGPALEHHTDIEG